MEAFSENIIRAAGYIMPLLAVWILVRCVRSMLREKYEPEVWAYLETKGGETAAIRHWECIIGAAKSCDIVISRDSVARTQAALIRSDRGDRTLHDLDSSGSCCVGKQRDEGHGISLHDGAQVNIADVELVFH